jgi:hypothetical protein
MCQPNLSQHSCCQQPSHDSNSRDACCIMNRDLQNVHAWSSWETGLCMLSSSKQASSKSACTCLHISLMQPQLAAKCHSCKNMCWVKNTCSIKHAKTMDAASSAMVNNSCTPLVSMINYVRQAKQGSAVIRPNTVTRSTV